MKKFSDLIEAIENKVNPPSARKDREEKINTKERALKLAGLSDSDIQDHGEPWENDANFTADVKQTKTAINANAAPGDQATPKAVQEAYADLEEAQINDIEKYINEIVDIVENEDFSSSDVLSQIALRLREARDVALSGIDAGETPVSESAMDRIMGRRSAPSPRDRAASERANHQFSDSIGGHSSNYKGNGFTVERPSFPQEKELAKKKEIKNDSFNESWHPGETKLTDGSSIFVNKLDAHYLNKLLSSAVNRESLDKLARRNAKEYTSILQFAKSLGESEELEDEDFLEEANEEAIADFFVENYSYEEIVEIEKLFEELITLDETSKMEILTPEVEKVKQQVEKAEEILVSVIRWLKYGLIAGASSAALASVPFVVKSATAGALAGGTGALAYHGGKKIMSIRNNKKMANAAKAAKPLALTYKPIREHVEALELEENAGVKLSNRDLKKKVNSIRQGFVNKGISRPGNVVRGIHKDDHALVMHGLVHGTHSSGFKQGLKNRLAEGKDCGCDDKSPEKNKADFTYEEQPGKKKKAFNLAKYLENNKKKRSK